MRGSGPNMIIPTVLQCSPEIRIPPWEGSLVDLSRPACISRFRVWWSVFWVLCMLLLLFEG